MSRGSRGAASAGGTAEPSPRCSGSPSPRRCSPGCWRASPSQPIAPTAQAIERIPAADRSLRAVWFGVPAARTSDSRLSTETYATPSPAWGSTGRLRSFSFRESTVAGQVRRADRRRRSRAARDPPVRPPAANLQARALRGLAAARSRRAPDAPGLRLVEVGTGTLRSQQLFGDFLAPDGQRHRRRRDRRGDRSGSGATTGPPRPRSSLPKAATCSRPRHRSRGRTAAMPGSGRSTRVLPGCGTSTSSSSGPSGRGPSSPTRSISFAVDAPVGGAPSGRARRARRRQAAAARRRRGRGSAPCLHRPRRARPAPGLRRCAPTSHLVRRSTVAALAPDRDRERRAGVLGVLVGWLVGSAVGALAARLAGAPPLDVLRHSVLSPTRLALALGAALVAAALIALTISLRPRAGAAESRRSTSWRSPRCSIVAVALLGGAADEDRLASGAGSRALCCSSCPVLSRSPRRSRDASLPARSRGWARDGAGARCRRASPPWALRADPGQPSPPSASSPSRSRSRWLPRGTAATLVRGRARAGGVPGSARRVVREDLQNLVRVFDAASPARFQKLVGRAGRRIPCFASPEAPGAPNASAASPCSASTGSRSNVGCLAQRVGGRTRHRRHCRT